MAYELTAAETWLKRTLRGDPEIMEGVRGVFDSIADQTDDDYCRAKNAGPDDFAPYIVFNMQSGGTDENAAASRVFASPVYQVQVVSQGLAKDVDPVLQRIDALLTEARATVDGVRIRCKSAGLVRYTEVLQGVLYHHQGRLWRLYLSS